ncbi:sulfatase [Natronorarus salvus]|uniref:sulfatase n=1 Tax=Natronorarus salvus TaxID=3117733 RepID=UPI002F265450
MANANVLLIVADSLRARNTSLLGYRRETTPFLDSFADRATVYTQARSPSNWTLPSHVSLFSGYDAHEHGFDLGDRLDPGHTVFEELAGKGYETGLFSDNPFLTEHESGLETVFEYARGTPDSFPPEFATNGDLGDWPNGFWYVEELLEWTGEREGPWAACLNLMDTHRPYEPLEEYDRWSDERVRALQETMGFKWHWEFLSGNVSLGFANLLEAIYDGAIRQADAITERVVTALEDRGELEGTLVVVCSDHGESFGSETVLDSEPPAVSHRIGTHDDLYHVPLVVKAPGQDEGQRVDHLATLTRFPEAVRSLALDERRVDGPTFAVDRAFASQPPIGPAMAREAERICGDAEPFSKHARIVYEEVPGDSVLKRAAWGEEAYETLIRGRNERVDRGEIPAQRVLSAFEGSERVDLASPLEEYTEFAEGYDNEFADELEDRLEALGYR